LDLDLSVEVSVGGFCLAGGASEEVLFGFPEEVSVRRVFVAAGLFKVASEVNVFVAPFRKESRVTCLVVLVSVLGWVASSIITSASVVSCKQLGLVQIRGRGFIVVFVVIAVVVGWFLVCFALIAL